MEDVLAEELQAYLRPTAFIDSDSSEVIQFAQAAAGAETTDVGRAVRLFYAVRDGIYYDPYQIDLSPLALRASTILEKGFGFCVTKSILLAALARAVGIPSRLGFADLRNYQIPERLFKLMETDVFLHGYAELLLDHRWVKATTAYNLSLCERFGIIPIEFDGKTGAIFREFDRQGRRHVEYLRDHGTFADVPYDQMVELCREYYPKWFNKEKTFCTPRSS
jgi:transglutaminase-like putative cysteine protease